MKATMPLKVRLEGVEDVVVIDDVWNTVKNWGFGVALIAFVFLFCAYGFPALLIVLAIAAVIFGGWMVFKQKTALEKICASVILAVLIGGLLFGASTLQKPASVVNSLPQATATTPTPPTTTVVTAPAPQVTVNIPDRVHIDAVVETKPAAQQIQPDPMAGMTPEERRQYEIWVLRK